MIYEITFTMEHPNRASMPQCVQYDTTHCITCIKQHLWHHMHNIIQHISSLVIPCIPEHLCHNVYNMIQHMHHTASLTYCYHTIQHISSLAISCITEHLWHNVYNMVQLIASHTSHSIYDTICTIWYNTYHHRSSHVSQSICYNLHNVILLIASHASHSISNIMLPYNTTHIITGHLLHHRASMPQCVQYDTTHCISCITQHL